MNFGFIGLGRMGNHMARHLAEAGNQVAAFDLRPEAVSSLAETRGVRPARGVGGAALNAAVVCTSLPGPKEVEAVVLAPGGLLESMQPGSTYVDLSTNSPTLVRRLASALAERGIAMLDAPVSGGVAGAEAATLSVMVGGDEAVFERLRPALAPIGSKLFYCGASGAGNVVKLCNNIAGQGYALVLGEVLTLGVKAGVDLKTLAKVIGNSTGTSTRLTRAFPRRLFRRNFESPGFSAPPLSEGHRPRPRARRRGRRAAERRQRRRPRPQVRP